MTAFGGNNTAGEIDTAMACNAKGGSGRMDFESETLITHSLRAEGHDASEDGTGRGVSLQNATWRNTPKVNHGAMVRRLTPTECERLMGLPDGYTLVPHRGKPAKDGPRYKALGNSWAIPVARWIGERIEAMR